MKTLWNARASNDFRSFTGSALFSLLKWKQGMYKSTQFTYG